MNKLIKRLKERCQTAFLKLKDPAALIQSAKHFVIYNAKCIPQSFINPSLYAGDKNKKNKSSSVKLQLVISALFASFLVYLLTYWIGDTFGVLREDISFSQILAFQIGLAWAVTCSSIFIATVFYILTITNACDYKKGDYMRLCRSMGAQAPRNYLLIITVTLSWFVLVSLDIDVTTNIFYSLPLIFVFSMYWSISKFPNIGPIRAAFSISINSLWIACGIYFIKTF